MGDVTATIKCRDGINHLWDLIVNADFMRDGEITDNAIGNRTLLDNAGDGNLIATTAKKLTAWLQGLRNNVKWLFTHLNAHIADTVIHITAAEKTEWFAKYNKPAAGIPKTDLDVNVQASLDKADASATAHALDEETTRAIEAETSLQASIDDEAAARETADTALQADIDAEAAARETADTAEATTRSQADTTLQTNITAEATARQAADTAEATARSQADTPLQTNLNTETARAQDAEDTLQDNLDAEATARENADTALQAGIDAAADAADAAQATADAAKAIAESAIHLKGVLMFGADTVASMQSIPTARLNDGDACGVHETNLSYKWNAADQAWGELAHGADEVGDQWNINSWYGVWQNQTFTGNATATIICIRTEPLYCALSVSESTPVGGDLGIDGAHIDILQQTAPSPITESLLKFGGGFAAKFSGFFQAVVAKINGIFSLLDLEEGKRESADAVLQANIDAEEALATAAEDAKVDKEAGAPGQRGSLMAQGHFEVRGRSRETVGRTRRLSGLPQRAAGQRAGHDSAHPYERRPHGHHRRIHTELGPQVRPDRRTLHAARHGAPDEGSDERDRRGNRKGHHRQSEAAPRVGFCPRPA